METERGKEQELRENREWGREGERKDERKSER
jgi:hypothetical protein